jgi:hypothetical protein
VRRTLMKLSPGDWTFEEAMAELGCTIRAFDPTIEADTKPKSDLVSV